MKFKFLLTLLLCLALVCCFASCGSEGDDGDSEEAYTVTFKTNCGAFVKSVKVKNGKKVPQPEAIENPGYTFSGWYYGDEKWSFAGHTVTDDMTLEARWFANENYLSLDRNGAPYEAISGTSMAIKTGQTKNIVKNPFKWNNRKFLGWSTTPDGPVEYADCAPYTMGTKSTKLYAVWDRTTSNIVFDGNGVESGAMIDAVIKNGATANLPKNTYVRQGYVFKGWSTTPNGPVEYLDGASYTMGTDDTYILYAVWESEGFTITYHCNGGEANPENPVTFTVEDLPIKLSDLSNQENRLFNYWYYESDFSGSPVFEITEPKNITLYAEFVDGSDGLGFQMSGSTWNITKYEGTAKDVIIPAQYKGKTVKNIKTAFYNSNTIRSITIPSSVVSIAEGALRKCKNLESISVDKDNPNYKSIDGSLYTKDGKTLLQYATGKKDETFVVPEDVTTISAYAFSRSQYCETIIVTDNVTKIGNYAFSSCPNLMKVVVPASMTLMGEVVNQGSPILTMYCEIAENECTWPSYWKTSSCHVVWDCNNNNVATNGNIYVVQDNVRYALKDGKATVVRQGKNIAKAIIASSISYGGQNYPVTSIVGEAFYDCDLLVEVLIPSSVISVAENSIYQCSCVTVYCEASKRPSGWHYNWNPGIYPAVIWDCNNNDSTSNGCIYTVIDGIRYMIDGEGAHVVAQPKNITRAIIPESITYKGQQYSVVGISGSAFSACKDLTEVVIPNSIKTIGMYAFSSCNNLKSIIIPSSVERVEQLAIKRCESLTIYCEVEKRPLSWDSDWNEDNCPVVWGYKE
ncbi:MAG: leucine-rich repeat protein [Clostridia bacterium]|nr:leucine-rich repeat protein [Clostridia bacterium]